MVSPPVDQATQRNQMAEKITSHPKFAELREAILGGENPRDAIMRMGAMDLGMAIQAFNQANPGKLQQLIMNPPAAPALDKDGDPLLDTSQFITGEWTTMPVQYNTRS